MDNLQNMMAEMQKMQQQMQEMAAKQAEEAEAEKAKKASRIKTVSLDDLNRLSEKLSAAEEALQVVGDEVNALKQAILDSMNAAQEEGGELAKLRAELEQIIANTPYEGIKMGKVIEYDEDREEDTDTGYPMFVQLYDTIKDFESILYDYDLNDNGALEKFANSLYRTVYCNNAEKYKFTLVNPKAFTAKKTEDTDVFGAMLGTLLSGMSTTQDTSSINASVNTVHYNDQYDSQDDWIDVFEDKDSKSIRVKIKALNKKRSAHLLAMQNEAMELLLAEVAKYI